MTGFRALLGGLLAIASLGPPVDAQTRPSEPPVIVEGPVVRDISRSWLGGARRVLRARVGAGPIAPGALRVELRYARHHWPGADRAHRIRARRTTGTLGESRWEATPPAAVAALRGDTLFHEWHVTYDTPTGRRTIVSPRAEQTVGCLPTQTRADLIALQRAAGAFDVPVPQVSLAALYPVPTHGMTVLENIGFSLAKPGVAMGTDRVRFGSPDLVMYAPRPRRVNENRSAYRRAMRDGLPDAPYRLIGWVHAEPHTSTRRRPSLGCVPSKHWFLHEAGYHLSNGGFQPTPPLRRERVRGERLVRTMADARGTSGLSPARPVWHPRIWDLHLWIDPDPICDVIECPPIIAIAAPAPVIGLPTPRGNTFFRVETFE